MTKIIAMHLPQYHTIRENDEWWGEGFTEWTNVRKAIPLFEGHLQPRVPYEYYDLSDVGNLINQMNMANEYGVDGFAFYHYWFCGKKLLEKPIEDLLGFDSLPIDYCLCWANDHWNRRWDGHEKEVLMKQEYGGEDDWINHYLYLSQFFKKSNYLKKDNNPIIIIYDKGAIPNIREMYCCWRKMALKDGFDGLHIIEAQRKALIGDAPFLGDAVMRFEPFATLRCQQSYRMESIIREYSGIENDRKYSVIDYNKFCAMMTSRLEFRNENQYLGFFAGWDNSPRIGQRVTIIFENNSPDIFEKYLRIQFEKSVINNNEYLFINAWNEWGEGTFLEPDEKYGYGYLEAIKHVKNALGG